MMPCSWVGAVVVRRKLADRVGNPFCRVVAVLRGRRCNGNLSGAPLAFRNQQHGGADGNGDEARPHRNLDGLFLLYGQLEGTEVCFMGLFGVGDPPVGTPFGRTAPQRLLQTEAEPFCAAVYWSHAPVMRRPLRASTNGRAGSTRNGMTRSKSDDRFSAVDNAQQYDHDGNYEQDMDETVDCV